MRIFSDYAFILKEERRNPARTIHISQRFRLQ